MKRPIKETIQEYGEIMDNLVEHIDKNMVKLLPFCLDKIAETIELKFVTGVKNKHTEKRLREFIADAFALWCYKHFQDVREHHEEKSKDIPKA